MSTEILTCSGEKHRRRVAEKLVEVAKVLRGLRAYNSMFFVMWGLKDQNVERLTPLWQKLSSKTLSQFQELSHLCQVSNNFKNYREELEGNAPSTQSKSESGSPAVEEKESSSPRKAGFFFMLKKKGRKGRVHERRSLSFTQTYELEEAVHFAEEGRMNACVPYLGIFLKDITAVEESNESFLDKENINWEKMQMLANIKNSILQFQKDCN